MLPNPTLDCVQAPKIELGQIDQLIMNFHCVEAIHKKNTNFRYLIYYLSQYLTQIYEFAQKLCPIMPISSY
jgi:hypothetical protein